MKGKVVVLALGAASACVGFNIRASSECADLCKVLSQCGFLPSPLGWANDGDPVTAIEDCERRCGNSPVSDPTVAAILSCYAGANEGTGPNAPWCEQSEGLDEAGLYEEWEPCDRIADCLDRSVDSPYILGDVELTIQAMTSDDYKAHLNFPVSSWPPGPGESEVLQSCQPSLCGPDLCERLECSVPTCDSTGTSAKADDEATASGGDTCLETCQLPEGARCDPGLCRVGALTISRYCDEMGAKQITIDVYSRDRLPGVDILEDAAANINSDCSESTLRIESDSYRISPGPVSVVAQVAGELVGASLTEIGYFDFPETMGQTVDEAAMTEYCIEMLGPAMTVHAGENTVVVPLGDLAALEAGEVVWRPCPR